MTTPPARPAYPPPEPPGSSSPTSSPAAQRRVTSELQTDTLASSPQSRKLTGNFHEQLQQVIVSRTSASSSSLGLGSSLASAPSSSSLSASISSERIVLAQTSRPISSAELGILSRRLKEVITCRTHTALLKKYRDCFRGKEAVDYLLNQRVAQTEAEAMGMCALMLQEHVFVRVITVTMQTSDRNVFAKSGLFRWYDEREQSGSTGMVCSALCAVGARMWTCLEISVYKACR